MSFESKEIYSSESDNESDCAESSSDCTSESEQYGNIKQQKAQMAKMLRNVSKKKFELIPPSDDFHDNYHETYEDIDVDKLNHILNNLQKFTKIMLENEHEPDYIESSVEIMEKVLNKSRQGRLKVLYRQRHKHGRYFADRGLSLQSFSRQLRHTVQKNYVDIDIHNCGPNILMFICKLNSISCPLLTEYCKNRQAFLKLDKLSVEDGKAFLIKMMNFDKTLNIEHRKLRELNYEIIKIQDMIAGVYSNKYKEFSENHVNHLVDSENDEEPYNVKGKFTSRLVLFIENKILWEMYRFYDSPNNAVLCFDGIMIKNKKNIKDTLEDCQQYVFDKIGINIKLAIKPFNESLPDSFFKNMKPYKEKSLQYWNDYTKLGSECELEHVEEFFRNSLVYNIKSGAFFKRRIDIDTDTKHKSLLHEELNLKSETKLDMNCNVINPKYDKKFIPDPKIKSKVADIRTVKYLYKNLFNTSGKSISYFDDIKGEVDELSPKQIIKIYPKFDFYPYLANKGEPDLNGSYNIWGGFPLEKIKLKKTINFEESLFYKHLKEYIMNNDEGELNHFIDTIADKLQRPTNARANAHIFYSLPGGGKSTLGKFLTMIFGVDHSKTFININNMFLNFNSDSTGKLLKIFEEMGARDGKSNNEANKKWEILKGNITSVTERTETKYKTPYEIRHCALYIFFTNHRRNMNLEATERRLTCHSIKSTEKKSKEYYNAIYAEMEDTQFMRNAFEYFATRKYKVDDIRECYQTAYKKAQQYECLTQGVKFVKSLIENNYQYHVKGMKDPKSVKLDKNGRIGGNELSAIFVKWDETNAGENHSRFQGITGLSTHLADFGIACDPMRINKKLQRGYDLREDSLLKIFRERLQDPTFQFDKLVACDDDEEDEEEEKEDGLDYKTV